MPKVIARGGTAVGSPPNMAAFFKRPGRGSCRFVAVALQISVAGVMKWSQRLR